jgi:hypothetical protein
LTEHRQPVVIAPDPWFLGCSTPDLLPKTWLTMPRD